MYNTSFIVVNVCYIAGSNLKRNVAVYSSKEKAEEHARMARVSMRSELSQIDRNNTTLGSAVHLLKTALFGLDKIDKGRCFAMLSAGLSGVDYHVEEHPLKD